MISLPEDEVGNALIAIGRLTGEAALIIGCSSKKERIGRLVAGIVGRQVIPAMGLIYADFTLVVQGKEALLGMDLGFRSHLGRGVNRRSVGA